MKPLTCEMCGSNDVIKQEGLFVCQVCGTKYSVEEARKMMIEGTVDVSGSTVKIDNSNSAKNFFMMAESAYSVKNNAEAEAYSNKVIEIEPQNSKAWMLKGKASGWQSTIAKPRIAESVLCFSKAISYASEEDKTEYIKLAREEFYNCSLALLRMCCNNFVKRPITLNSKTILTTSVYLQEQAIEMIKLCGVDLSDFTSDMGNLIDEAVVNAWPGICNKYKGSEGHPSKYEFETFKTACYDCIPLIKAAIQLDSSNSDRNIKRYQNLIMLTTELNNACSWKKNVSGTSTYWTKEYFLDKSTKNANIDCIMDYHNKIKEIDPSYTIPKRPKAGGCYVATCVYGSYDCPEVWTLRRYRDMKLAQSWHGRAFVHIYYAISPTIVKVFGERKWFKAVWKQYLDCKVKRLQMKGFESSPYNDQEW